MVQSFDWNFLINLSVKDVCNRNFSDLGIIQDVTTCLERKLFPLQKSGKLKKKGFFFLSFSFLNDRTGRPLVSSTTTSVFALISTSTTSSSDSSNAGSSSQQLSIAMYHERQENNGSSQSSIQQHSSTSTTTSKSTAVGKVNEDLKHIVDSIERVASGQWMMDSLVVSDKIKGTHEATRPMDCRVPHTPLIPQDQQEHWRAVGRRRVKQARTDRFICAIGL